ncbi:MAG TPA: hypothetical protein PLD88_15490, partial [Candidatus Berkiella sp.]|nr:hypothetical protein [Candidatus Berkiella sp.]
MHVTPREKVIATLSGIAGVGAAWAAFTLGFGSAPITLTTLAATPAATTAITGLAVGAGILAKKLASGALNLAIDGVEALAATHPDRNEGTSYRDKAYRGAARNFGQGTRFDRMFAGEYRPSHYSSEDYQLDADAGKIDAAEKKGLLADLASKAVDTFTRATLFSRGNKAVQYTLTPY